MPMNRFVVWARLGNKSKVDLQQQIPQSPTSPEGGQEIDKSAEATDSLSCHDSLDHHSADVGLPDDTPRSNGEDLVTPNKGAISGASASKLSIDAVESVHEVEIASLAARPDLPMSPSDAPVEQSSPRAPRLKHSKSFFTTFALAKKLRIRKPNLATLNRAPDNAVPARASDLSQRPNHRPKPVSIVLPDDIASKQRREQALRAMGLVPTRDLSAIEADEDRRIDALHKKSGSFSSSDNTHSTSDANDIANAWRIRNTRWLSESLPNLDTSEDPMTKATSSADTSNISEGFLALVAVGADDAPDPFLCSPSITKFLTLGSNDSPLPSLKGASSRGSIGHEVSPSLRADPTSPTSPEGLARPSSCLIDSPTIPTKGILEDVKAPSTLSAPSSPTPSKTSSSLHSQIAEKTQQPASSMTPRPSVSPSQQEDLQTPSLPHSSSEPRVELSSKPLPTESHPEPVDVPVQAQRSVPNLSPLLLFPIVSDTLVASPTTPTLSPSVCCSSETPVSTPTADNGVFVASPTSDVMPITDRRADITTFAEKNSEGDILSPEVILEGPEPFPDEDDLDPFAARPLSPLPTVNTSPPTRKSQPRNRSSTLGPSPSAVKPAPLTGLRRTFTSALMRRPRSRTTMSRPPAIDSGLTPPPSPLELKVHNQSTIQEETSRIHDDEIRRLAELAFMT